MEHNNFNHRARTAIDHLGSGGPPRKKGGPLRITFMFVLCAVLFSALICLPALGLARLIAEKYISSYVLRVFLGGALVILLLSFMLWGALALVRVHMRRHPNHHHPQTMPVYQEVLDAIERLSTGDFTVALEVDERHERFMLKEIAERLNTLAKQLSGMETMRQDFVANVSHEIQSPLTSISGFAALLQKPDLSPEKRRHYLAVIEAECARLSRLCDNLLKLSVLDADTGLRCERYRLDKQLGEVLLHAEPQWAAKNLDVKLEAGPCEVEGDRALLEQVWQNLVQNAVKFTPEGGTVSVELACEPGYILCSVRDSGPGIAAEDRPHVFERFYKGDKSRAAGTGSGLGLSLVKRIAQLHGGTVRLRAEEGGACFVVELPAPGAQNPAGKPKDEDVAC